MGPFHIKRFGFWLGPLLGGLTIWGLWGPSIPQSIPYMAGIAVLMAIWWMTEAIPLSVTALLPVVLFPFFGVMSGQDVATLYMNHLIFLFLGGFLMAFAMQEWGLHKRIALKILKLMGASSSRILIGFMGVTWFLSMWISNTAAAMMMVPIAMAFTQQETPNKLGLTTRFSTGIFLGIAYAASIGGMATLVGTPPNLSFARIYKISFPAAADIGFVEWMTVGFPISVAMLVVAISYLLMRFCRSDHPVSVASLDEAYQNLGPMKVAEQRVLFLFLTLAGLWVFRSPISVGAWEIPGWGSLALVPPFMTDGTVAIAVALLLFIIPSEKAGRPLLEGNALSQLPWGIVLLFGGGFALAAGFVESGLADYLGTKLQALSDVPFVGVLFLVCAMMTFLTELTSNTATTELVLPILASLSVAINIDPLWLMIPATLSVSCAFMLPVASPPNAIVFGSGQISISQMVRTGFILNFIGLGFVGFLGVILTML